MFRVLRPNPIAVLAAAWCLACASTVAAASDAEFRRLLSAPDDPQLNRQYAASAEARGDLRHALAALDRALSANPNDPELISAYDRVRRKLLPTTTAVTVQIGSSYASNPRQVSDGDASKEGDEIVDAAISIEDERTIGGVRLRSLAYAAGQVNVETSELSTGIVSVQSGPVFTISDNMWVHIAPGVASAWLDDSLLYTETSAAVTFGTVFEGMTQTLTARYGARFGSGSSLDYQDGQVAEVIARLVRASNFTYGDYIYLEPRFRWSDVFGDINTTQMTATAFGPLSLTVEDLSPYSYREWGGRISYFIPVDNARSFYLGAGLSVYQRDFDTFVFDPALLALGGHVSTGEKRGDIYVEPTAHMIFPNLVAPNVDFRVDYRFEHNDSNDESRDFHDHVAGIRVVGRF